MKRNRLISHVACLAIFILAIGFVIFGCGGGGGGSSGDGGSTTSSNSTGTTSDGVTKVALVAVFEGTQSPANTGAGNAVTAGVGDHIQFEYVGVSTTNSSLYKVVSGGSLSTNVPSSVANLSSGILTVLKASSPTVYTVVGSYGGKAMSISFTTVGALAKVSGQVTDPSGSAVIGVPVTFYAGSKEVGAAMTGTDGSFVGEVPTTATEFSVDFGLYSSLYYNEYAYGTFDYSALTAGCYAPLPGLTVSKSVPLPNQVVPFFFDSNSPPPPPTGCN